MTVLEAVACYLPERKVPIEQVADRLGLPSLQVRMYRRFLGLDQIRLDPDDGSLLDLLAAAASRLGGLHGREHLVRYVLHARVMPAAVPYPVNPLHELCGRLGLDRAVSFTVTHNACATGLLAIDLAGRLLAAGAEPGALALVLAGEKTFTRDAQLVPGISVFGEGAAACLVSADGPGDAMLSYATITRGEFDGRLDELPDLAARFEKEYPELLTEVLLAAVDRAGLALGDIGLILPHNVNTRSWQRLCRRIGLDPGRVLLGNVPVTGHVFAADCFVNYVTAIQDGLLAPGDRYLLAAAGLGSTFTAMVFERGSP